MHSSNNDMVEIRIELFKGARSLGVELSIHKYKTGESYLKPRIFVNNLTEGGLLQSDGRIKVGDWLLAVKQYLPNGESLTFEFDDGYASNDTNEANQTLRRCKRKMEIYVLRKLNLEEVPLSPNCENNGFIDGDKSTEIICPSFDGNLGIFRNYNLESETNQPGYRDSVTTYKVQKPRRQNACKRYALRFQDQAIQDVEYSKEEVFASLSDNTKHSINNTFK